MSDVAKSSSESKPRAEASWLKTNYLLAFNAISAFSWLALLWHATLGARVGGLSAVHEHIDSFWKVTQSLAAIEIVHSLFGEFPPCLL
jgi:very-long-chain (3R)-3-hydroxyacyl-CoA dehydratase